MKNFIACLFILNLCACIPLNAQHQYLGEKKIYYGARRNFNYFNPAYRDINLLNELWCAGLWSQEYSYCEQIPLSKSNVWYHLSLRFN